VAALAATVFIGATALALRGLPPLDHPVRWPVLALATLAGVPMVVACNAAEYRVSAGLVGARVGLAPSIRVSVLASTANLLPVPGSAVVRTQALRAAGTSTGRAVSATGVVAVAWLGLTFAAAGALLVATGAAPATGVLLLACGSGAVALAALAIVFGLRPPDPAAAVARVLAVEAALVVVAAVRLWLVVRGLGFEASIGQATALSIAAVVASATGLLPGGLGVRELVAAGISPVVGLPASVGLAATAVARISELAVLAPWGMWLVLRPSPPAPVLAPTPAVAGRAGDGGGVRT
jgi:hypothetical protein